MGLIEFILQKQKEMTTLYEHELLGDEVIDDIFGQIIERIEEFVPKKYRLDKIDIIVPVGKDIQRYLTNDKYYRDHYEEDYTEVFFSETFSLAGEEYKVSAQYCVDMPGSEDSNGWIDIIYWQKKDGVFCEINGADPVFQDGDFDVYKIGDTLIVTSIEFEKGQVNKNE